MLPPIFARWTLPLAVARRTCHQSSDVLALFSRRAALVLGPSWFATSRDACRFARASLSCIATATACFDVSA